MKLATKVPVFILFGLLCFAPVARAAETDEQALRRIAQELLDAVAPGDKAVWERYLADTCVYLDENGDTYTKAQLLADFRPLPAGYKGSIRIADAKVQLYGDTAVIVHRDVETLELYGQTLVTEFRTTASFVRRDGRWQMIATQVMVVPSERKPVAVDSKAYDAVVGQYEIVPGVTYTVTHEGGKLMGQRSGRDKEELLPANETTFYRKGTWRGEKVFVRDAKGRVTEMLERRDNNDLVWKKIK